MKGSIEKVLIKYRFLEGKKSSNSPFEVFAMVYSGFDEYPENNGDYTSLIYGRMERTFSINKPIEGLTEKDIPSIFSKYNVSWSKIKEHHYSMESDWVPDDLFVERMEYLDSVREAKEKGSRQERKAA